MQGNWANISDGGCVRAKDRVVFQGSSTYWVSDINATPIAPPTPFVMIATDDLIQVTTGDFDSGDLASAEFLYKANGYRQMVQLRSTVHLASGLMVYDQHVGLQRCD